MTRKDYIAMARELKDIEDEGARIKAAHAFWKVAKADNPRFDPHKFFAACGLSEALV